jgi:hypothetical protein
MATKQEPFKKTVADLITELQEHDPTSEVRLITEMRMNTNEFYVIGPATLVHRPGIVFMGVGFARRTSDDEEHHEPPGWSTEAIGLTDFGHWQIELDDDGDDDER